MDEALPILSKNSKYCAFKNIIKKKQLQDLHYSFFVPHSSCCCEIVSNSDFSNFLLLKLAPKDKHSDHAKKNI